MKVQYRMDIFLVLPCYGYYDTSVSPLLMLTIYVDRDAAKSAQYNDNYIIHKLPQ